MTCRRRRAGTRMTRSALARGDDLDPFADPASTNLFSAEIENVNASDWDVDTNLIWGDDGGDAVEGGEILGLDLPF